MRHALILSTVLFAACAASGAAMAQQSSTTGAGGLRYLSWPGKPPIARTTAPSLRRIAPQPTPVAALDAPARALPLARLDAPARTPSTPRRGLTPASDWIAPAANAPEPAAAPRAYVASEAAPETSPQTAPEAPPPIPAVSAPAPAPAPAPTEAAPEPAFDPMAPRRDAPIFRMQRQTEAAPQTVAQPPADAAADRAESGSAQPPAMVQAALAPVQGPRFYSVHRQAGRQPDPINAVQPIYLDALPVEMTQTPSSADLAQPDGPPALLRGGDGKVRAMPQTQGDDLP